MRACARALMNAKLKLSYLYFNCEPGAAAESHYTTKDEWKPHLSPYSALLPLRNQLIGSFSLRSVDAATPEPQLYAVGKLYPYSQGDSNSSRLL